MLLTAMMVSAMVIAATSLAGLITLYQLRQITDVKNSGKAIFAADAGVECLSYKYVKESGNVAINCGETTKFTLSSNNGAYFTASSTGAGTYISIGTSGRSSRAFEIEATST